MNESGTPPTPPDESTPSSAPPPPAPAPPEAAPAKKKGKWGKWVALGCGCGCLVVLIVGAIIAWLLIPTLQKGAGLASDAKAVSLLRNGVTAAMSYYTDHDAGYDGMDASALSSIESSTKFDDGAPSIDQMTGVVYVDKSSVGAREFVLSTKSESGKLLRVKVKDSQVDFEQSEDGVGWTKPEWPKP